jgi:hypothetical protein
MGDILGFEADRRVISMKLNLLDMLGDQADDDPDAPKL